MDNLNSVYFVDDNTSYVVGENGRILKTTDAGENWSIQNSSTNNDLIGVYFIGDTGWAVGIDGTIIKTTNGGSNWIKKNGGVSEELRDVFFTDLNNGWAVGADGVVIKTTNSGENWNPQNSGKTYTLQSVYFINNDTGWVVGNGGIIINTTDGGANWQSQSSNTDYSLQSVFFINSNVGWIAGAYNRGQFGKILKTTNGGYTWLNEFDTQAYGSLYSIKFNDENNGIAVGISGTIYQTSNGGNGWIKENGGTNSSLQSVYLSNEKAISIGYGGVILRSEDMGINWKLLSTNNSYTLGTVTFINDNLGWAAGNSGIIIHTSDGGENWQIQESLYNQKIGKIFFADSLHGWCIGTDSIILKSNNGGINWNKINILKVTNFVYSNLRPSLNSIFFVDSLNGWIVGGDSRFYPADGLILKTTNGGNNWNQILPNFGNGYMYFTDVFFINKNNGWVTNQRQGDAGGFVMKTTDGGQNWLIVPASPSSKYNFYNTFYKVSFTTTQRGWILGGWAGGPYISRTTDGGNTWRDKTPIRLYSNFGFKSIRFFDDVSGFLLGLEGDNNISYFVKSSDDAGNTWDSSLYVSTRLNEISFTDRNNGWVVGDNGTIYKYTFKPEIDANLWKDNISIESNLEAKTITFGQSPDATDGIDADLGEEELPPPPPSGNLDLRFNLPNSMSTITDIRNSSEDKITWTLKFQPDTSGYPLTFLWNRYALPDGSFRLRDNVTGNIIIVDMKVFGNYVLTNSGINTLLIEYSKNTCVDVAVNKGWNLLSIPFPQSNGLFWGVDTLFSTAISSAFVFNSNAGTFNEYKTTTSLDNGVGFWLKFNQNDSKQFCGLPFYQPISCMNSGWYIIGPYNVDVPVSQVLTHPADLLSSKFFGYNNGYYIPNTLETGKGYWIRTSQNDGSIQFGLGVQSNINKVISIKIPAIEIPIYIGDRDGGRDTLLVGLDSTATDSIDTELGEAVLPPLPPTGAFDARLNIPNTQESSLSDFRFGPETGQFERVYQVQYQRGEGNQIVLSWNLPDGLTLRVQDIITGNVIDNTFEPGIDSIVVTNPDAFNKLKLTVTFPSNYTSIKELKLIPKEFVLFQNYPNPFNPSTTIKYALPFESSVDITIFNIIGQRIKEFGEGIKEAGYHNVVWQPKDLSSGVYFYSINAKSIDGKNDYSKTLKMLYMK